MVKQCNGCKERTRQVEVQRDAALARIAQLEMVMRMAAYASLAELGDVSPGEPPDMASR